MMRGPEGLILLTRSDLFRRDWTGPLESLLLGEADYLAPSPSGRGDICLYELRRVQQMEKLPEFMAARDAARRRGFIPAALADPHDGDEDSEP